MDYNEIVTGEVSKYFENIVSEDLPDYAANLALQYGDDFASYSAEAANTATDIAAPGNGMLIAAAAIAGSAALKHRQDSEPGLKKRLDFFRRGSSLEETVEEKLED